MRSAVSQRVIVILERFRANLIRASASKCQSRMGELPAYLQVEVERPAEGPAFPGSGCGSKVAQHVMQDAAVAIVLQLIHSIDPAEQRDFLRPTVSRCDDGGQLRPRLDVRESADADRLVALEPE